MLQLWWRIQKDFLNFSKDLDNIAPSNGSFNSFSSVQYKRIFCFGHVFNKQLSIHARFAFLHKCKSAIRLSLLTYFT